MITEEMLIKARHIIMLHNHEQLLIKGVMHILTCPFCSDDAYIKTTTFGDSMIDNYSIECKNGHSLDYWNEDKNDVISYWNNRK